MSKQRKTTVFSGNFLWGASTSAHQHEGGNHNQWTVWERQNAPTKAAQASYVWIDIPGWGKFENQASKTENYVSGRAVEHYQRYKEDLALLKKLNLNTIRFSIEWSRVEPEEGKWKVEEIQHYREYLDECAQLSITPVVTLFHFTLPTWFAAKGGFEKRRNIKYFTRFAEKIFTELGNKFEYCITINEPNVYAIESYLHGVWPPNVTSFFRAKRVLKNQLTAHKRVATLAKKHNSNLKLSPAFNVSYVYAGDDAWLSKIAARVINYLQNTYMLQRAAKHCDYIGINYYFTSRVFGYRIHNPDRNINDMGWDMQPQNIDKVIQSVAERYDKPILITENGLADAGDVRRNWWLVKTLQSIQVANKKGANVIGYIHWSLLDNFEWDKGRWPRFGLIEVDYATMERKIRPSAKKLAAFIRLTQKEGVQNGKD